MGRLLAQEGPLGGLLGPSRHLGPSRGHLVAQLREYFSDLVWVAIADGHRKYLRCIEGGEGACRNLRGLRGVSAA